MDVENFVEEQTIDSSGGYVSAGFFYDNANIEGNLGLFSSGYIRTESGDISTEAFGAIAAGGYTNVEKDLFLAGGKFYMSGGNLADIKGFVNVRNNSVLEAAVTGAKFNVGKKLDVRSAVIDGNLTQTAGAGTNIENNSSVEVGGIFSSERSEVSVTGNSSLDVGKNLTLTDSSNLKAENSSSVEVGGDFSSEDSEVAVTDKSSLAVNGNMTVSDAANAHIGKDSVLTVGKTFSVKDATLNIENGKLLLSGENAVLDLTSNGVLKTNAEGSVKIEKGAQVKSKTATLVSEDKTTTAEGVAEKTFDADALSKVSLVDFGETTLDEAKKLHSILFT